MTVSGLSPPKLGRVIIDLESWSKTNHQFILLLFHAKIRHVDRTRCVITVLAIVCAKSPVNVKHAGKTYPVEVDTSAPGSAFKESIYQTTGIPAGELQSFWLQSRAKFRTNEGDGERRYAQGGLQRAVSAS